jgi:hypothetical protein
MEKHGNKMEMKLLRFCTRATKHCHTFVGGQLKSILVKHTLGAQKLLTMNVPVISVPPAVLN